MRTSTLPVGRGVTVHWVVPGLLADGLLVARALAEASPRAVAVGVSPAELDGLVHHLDEPTEDEGWTGEPFAVALSRYGAVGFPPPPYVAAVRYAVEHGVPLHALDLTDEAYDERFTKLVSTWQWWRYGRRMRKLEKKPPKAPDAEAFAEKWDARLRSSGKGIRAVEAARESAVVEALAKLATETGAVAVLDTIHRPGVEALAARR